MKKIINCLILIATMTFLSCEKDPDTPADEKDPDMFANFTASQGTYVGVVHIAYGELDGTASVYRFNEENANWEEISWNSPNKIYDNGHDLIGHLVPGKEYRYKMRQHSVSSGYSEYSNEITGYTFKGSATEITSINRENNGDKVDITISWRNPNDLTKLKNLTGVAYKIYRIENGNLSDYDPSYINGGDESPPGIEAEWSCIDTGLDPGKTYSYRVNTVYSYDYTTVNDDYRDWEAYMRDGTFVEEGDSGNGTGNDDNPVINYTTTDMGQLIAAASGDIIVDIKEKVVNGDVYLGVITGNTVEATPALFKYDGSAFENVWTCNDLSSSTSLHYAITSLGESYVAGTGDSLCIYKREGSSWSQDIAPDNIVLAGIEVFNDELYLFAKSNEVRQVMKYNGTSWDKIGETIASGSIYNANIETLDDVLYVHYTIDNTLYIKHLSGSSWVSDLEWTQEYMSNIQLAKNGGDLYFSTSTASMSDYDGGVYRVSGSTSVENLIPDGAADSWFLQGAFTMSVDSDGNLIVSSIKGEKISDTEVILYPHLILYDGSQWNTVSGDFTDGRDPIGVSTTGTDIFYFYGEKATQNSSQQSTVLKAKKLTK
ncbi:MAG: hypothetical protein P9M03_01845 [Candidatus Theseobacter exili]|nr:hypothetical protein [Candidatus Theseobacter exili]